MNTKISDNYIYESVLDLEKSDSDKTPFLRKNLNYVVDQQNGNGNYQSGQIIIDATSLASSANNFNDWSNAYIVLPYNVKLTGQFDTATSISAASLPICNYLTSLKNNAVIDSITVEQGGKTIINQSSNLSQLINFKLHSTTSQDNLNKMSSSLQYFPDSVGAYTYSAGSIGLQNISNNPNSTTFTTPEAYNAGALTRQQKLFPYTTALTTQAKQINEGDVVQLAGPIVVAPVPVAISDLHFLMTIRLKDLTDYFAKHSKLTRGIGYKITVRVNQGFTTFTHIAPAKDTTPISDLAITAQSFTGIGGSIVMPAMLHAGLAGVNTLAQGLITTTVATQLAASSLVLTAQVDTGAQALLNGARLYVPSYEMNPTYQEKIMALPVINRTFFDSYFTQIQNQAKNSYINAQIATGISNPKAIVIVPQIAQQVNNFNSQASAFNPSPGTTDPQLSLTNTQVKVGSQYVLPDRVNYDFVQFLENNQSLFGLNGGQTDMLSSGIIDFTKWRHNYRYYVYDLSRYPASTDNVAQMLTLESFNNSDIAIDLYVYVLYERSAEFNLVAGSLQVE